MTTWTIAVQDSEGTNYLTVTGDLRAEGAGLFILNGDKCEVFVPWRTLYYVMRYEEESDATDRT